MKSKFYIPKLKYRWIYTDKPTKIKKIGEDSYHCIGEGFDYVITKSALSRFKICPKSVIEEEIRALEGMLMFYGRIVD